MTYSSKSLLFPVFFFLSFFLFIKFNSLIWVADVFMDSPPSSKKHELNIWQNWPLGWKLHYNRGGFLCPGLRIILYVCHFKNSFSSLFFFLSFFSYLLFEQSFRKLQKFGRLHRLFFKFILSPARWPIETPSKSDYLSSIPWITW